MVPLPPKPPNKRDQIYLKELLEAGKVAPVINLSGLRPDWTERVRK